MSDREFILNKLRKVQKPALNIPDVGERLRVVPLGDLSREEMRERFLQEAKKLGCVVHPVNNEEDAIEQILTIIGDDKTIMAWDANQILPKLKNALKNAKIKIAELRDSDVRCGVTGVGAGLASTGSMVLQSGKDRPRQASLLPDVHIAVVRTEQLVLDLETWFKQQRKDGFKNFRNAANTVVISGPSRTADIGMELVMGAHGPREVHVILI